MKDIPKICNVGQRLFVLIMLNLLSIVKEFNSCGESNFCLTQRFLRPSLSGKVFKIKALGGIILLLHLPGMVAEET